MIQFSLLTYISKCAIFHLQCLSVIRSPQTAWPTNPQARGDGYQLKLDPLLVFTINYVCPLLFRH